MEWRGRRQSSNIEDRRADGSSGNSGGGGGRRSGGSVGVGGGLGLVAIVVVGWFFGIDLTPLLNGGGGGGTASTGSYTPGPMTTADKDAGEFVAVTLGATEDIWAKVFKEQLGKTYHPVTLVLFKGVTASPCGDASGATGPFYCPGDKKVYLDTAFFDTCAGPWGKGRFCHGLCGGP